MASLRDILRRRLAAGFWSLRFRDLGEILGRILAAEISESRRDLGDILGQDFGRRDPKSSAAKILPRISTRSRRDLGKNFVRGRLRLTPLML